MQSTFGGCTDLKTTPVIPSSVTSIWEALSGCTSLTGNIEINSTTINSYENYSCCLYETRITSISGSCPREIKEAIIAESGLSGVTIID